MYYVPMIYYHLKCVYYSNNFINIEMCPLILADNLNLTCPYNSKYYDCTNLSVPCMKCIYLKYCELNKYNNK